MDNSPSHKQNALLEKLWMRSQWGDGTAIKKLQDYYAPKLTAIAFTYLGDLKRAIMIVEKVVLDTLFLWEKGIPDIGEFMMNLVIERCIRYIEGNTEGAQ